MNTQRDGDPYQKFGLDCPELPNGGAKLVAVLVIAGLSVLISLGVGSWSVLRPTFVTQGQVHAAAIEPLPNVMDTAQSLHVTKGNDVQPGESLVSLENDAVQARPEQAHAAIQLPREHQMLRSASTEYIGAHSNLWVNAKAVAERAEQTVAHSRALQAQGVLSVQELRDLERSLDWARSCQRAAKASFDLAVALFGSEEKLATEANFEPAGQRVEK